MAELSLCPFCGSPVNSARGVKGTMFFKCTNKKSCGAVIHFENDYYNRYPEDAHHRFNKRADNDKRRD